MVLSFLAYNIMIAPERQSHFVLKTNKYSSYKHKRTWTNILPFSVNKKMCSSSSQI